MNPKSRSKLYSPVFSLTILLAINLAWGASYAVAKYALEVIPPSTLACIRFLVGGFFLLLIPNREHKTRLTVHDWKDLFIIGSFGLAISNALLNLGLQMTTSTKTAITASLEPIFTIFLAALMLKEVLQRRTIQATIVSIAGAAMLLLGGKTLSQLVVELSSSGGFLGDILVVLSIFTTALYSVLMKPVAQRLGAIRATSYSFLIGSLLLSPIAFLELSQLWPITFTTEALLAIMFLGVLCNAICYVIWNIILKHTEAGVMAVTLYAQPVGGVLVGWLWLGETLSATGIAGAALIFAGIWLLPGEPSDK
jgi:drug/metabolite transporter (DMT)-like permease